MSNKKTNKTAQTAEEIKTPTTPESVNAPEQTPTTEPKTTADKVAELVAKARTIIIDPTATVADRLNAGYIIKLADNPNGNPEELAEDLNKRAKAEVLATLYKGDAVKWNDLLKIVQYPQINPEAKEDWIVWRAVKVSDLFGIKTNKNSSKLALTSQPDHLFAVLNVFGGNLCESFHTSMESACILKVFTKYTDAPKCFFADPEKQTDPKSNSQLEKQLQTVCNSLFGLETVKIRKAHAVHLKAQFIKATTTDYRNGNELALLQLILNHARDAHAGKVNYDHKSKLTAHRQPKNQK